MKPGSSAKPPRRRARTSAKGAKSAPAERTPKPWSPTGAKLTWRDGKWWDGEFWFDAAAAELACDFFPTYLVHVKGELAGKPLALDEWQKERIIRPMFGWKRQDGTRRYRTVYIEIPRKNGKTTLLAGIALILLLVDREPGAEVYSAAADRDQAAIAFNVASQMVEAHPALAERCEVLKKVITSHGGANVYRVLSADVKTKHGFNGHGVLVDELHAQPNRDLWDVLTTSTGARRQPLTVAITTAGYDRHSICWEQHEYACKVRDGIIEDDSFLPIIFAADPDDDYTDPKVWAKANPGLGTSIREEYLAAECKKAQETPAYQNTFRRLHLNQWTEQATRWIDMTTWDEGAKPVPEFALRGRTCYAGLDLSSTTDITALALLFPPGDDGDPWELLLRFWMPEANIAKRARQDRVPYDQWVREGHIKATPGNIIDYDFIRAQVTELVEQFQIAEIAIDRWNSSQITTQLMADGMTLVPYGQGFKDMAQPTKDFEALVVGRRLLHGGNPVLRWMASNVAVLQDPAGNLKPDKGKSSERIDGIVAAIMALGRATVGDRGTSVYETGGISSVCSD